MLLLKARAMLGFGMVWVEAEDMSAVHAIFATRWAIFFSAAVP